MELKPFDHSKPMWEDETRPQPARTIGEIVAGIANEFPTRPLSPFDHSRPSGEQASTLALGPATFPHDKECRPIPRWVRDLPPLRENPSRDDPEWKDFRVSPELEKVVADQNKDRSVFHPQNEHERERLRERISQREQRLARFCQREDAQE
jgi:hypothetical protein